MCTARARPATCRPCRRDRIRRDDLSPLFPIVRSSTLFRLRGPGGNVSAFRLGRTYSTGFCASYHTGRRLPLPRGLGAAGSSVLLDPKSFLKFLPLGACTFDCLIRSAVGGRSGLGDGSRLSDEVRRNQIRSARQAQSFCRLRIERQDRGPGRKVAPRTELGGDFLASPMMIAVGLLAPGIAVRRMERLSLYYPREPRQSERGRGHDDYRRWVAGFWNRRAEVGDLLTSAQAIRTTWFPAPIEAVVFAMWATVVWFSSVRCP